jgi:hypothetical protein
MSANNHVVISDIQDGEIEALLESAEDSTLAPEHTLFDVLHAADKIDCGRWRMRCPAHDGAASSTLEVSLSGGRFRLKCACGCTTDEILRAAINAAARRREELLRAPLPAATPAPAPTPADPRPRAWRHKLPPRDKRYAKNHNTRKPT